ncbi:hypothetical protein, partial [Pseudomonas sp. C11]|uniref:hypothetical protein n=1 Tax=Pseudomonas sp. C11 TaxID=3075550 RepID=UPI002B002C79
ACNSSPDDQSGTIASLKGFGRDTRVDIALYVHRCAAEAVDEKASSTLRNCSSAEVEDLSRLKPLPRGFLIVVGGALAAICCIPFTDASTPESMTRFG